MSKEMQMRMSAMRMAVRKGVNPYDSRLAQGTAYTTLWRMRQGSVQSTPRNSSEEISEWFHAD